MKTAILFFREQAPCVPALLPLAPHGADAVLLDGAEPPPLPPGLGRILTYNGPDPARRLDLWPDYAPLAQWLAAEGYQLLLLPAGEDADLLAPSLAWALDAGCVCGITAADLADGPLRVRRGVCGMELEGRFTLPALPAVLTVQTRGGPSAIGSYTPIPIPRREPPPPPEEFALSPREENGLADARLVLIAGRGAGGQLDKLRLLARRLGGQVGATRPVVFEGLAPVEELVGASAAVLSPEVCVVFGASGSAAFLVGVERSGTLVGVDLNRDAPLFASCDRGAVQDCAPLLDALLNLTEREDPHAMGNL